MIEYACYNNLYSQFKQHTSESFESAKKNASPKRIKNSSFEKFSKISGLTQSELISECKKLKHETANPIKNVPESLKPNKE